ncbi:MAG TPA: lasso peptide biosynthesis B2 protein [Vicinamibacterales bacterium]|nr:lasso peptide biosynthesis B2 protein [Vicinamibacterales bacterium]
MHAWRRLLRLPGRDRLLIAEAAGLIVAARLGMRLLPIERLRAVLARTRQEHRPHNACATEANRRVAWAVSSVASRLPGRNSCLIEALAAEAMLRRRGYECQLRLGVPPARPTNAPFAAHAWIEHDGHVVIGEVQDLPDYAVFSRVAER